MEPDTSVQPRIHTRVAATTTAKARPLTQFALGCATTSAIVVMRSRTPTQILIDTPYHCLRQCCCLKHYAPSSRTSPRIDRGSCALTQQYACPWECIRAELLYTRIQGGFLWGAPHLSPQLSLPPGSPSGDVFCRTCNIFRALLRCRLQFRGCSQPCTRFAASADLPIVNEHIYALTRAVKPSSQSKPRQH